MRARQVTPFMHNKCFYIYFAKIKGFVLECLLLNELQKNKNSLKIAMSTNRKRLSKDSPFLCSFYVLDILMVYLEL